MTPPVPVGTVPVVQVGVTCAPTFGIALHAWPAGTFAPHIAGRPPSNDDNVPPPQADDVTATAHPSANREVHADFLSPKRFIASFSRQSGRNGNKVGRRARCHNR